MTITRSISSLSTVWNFGTISTSPNVNWTQNTVVNYGSIDISTAKVQWSTFQQYLGSMQWAGTVNISSIQIDGGEINGGATVNGDISHNNGIINIGFFGVVFFL